MQITVINVGYGDAILFRTVDGYTLLLDGGSALESEFEGDLYRIRCAEFLKEQGVKRLDALVISHIHEDHVCGLEAVCRQTEIGHIYVPYPVEPFMRGCELHPVRDAFRSVPLYANALNAYRRILLHARESGIPITVLSAGEQVPLHQDFLMRILAPRPGAIGAYMELIEKAYRNAADLSVVTDCLTKLDATSNQTSMLLHFEMDDTAFLCAADSCPREWEEVPLFLLKNVSVLKLPHHGQKDSISEHFMREMPLEYVITTSASDRRYNSSNREVYERLTALRPDRSPPKFLFSDERGYPPYFSQPDGFQAITLEINSGVIKPEFIKIH